jgi:hypothetical protein
MSDTSVTLRLRSVDDFFHQPHLDPRSEWFEQYSLTSGLEYVIEKVADTPRTTHVRVAIELPAGAVEDGLAESVRSGIVRYCDARLRSVEHAAREDRSRGWLMLAFSIFVVFALVWVAQQFASRQETLLGVASEGLSIAAWVMLWHPLEHLVFNRWDHRLDGRVLRTVRDQCTVTIVPLETERAAA